MAKKNQVAIPEYRSLQDQRWFKVLVEDCDGIITESVFNSRWTLIAGYHQLGSRILAETDNFKKEKVYGQNITQSIAASLGKSQRTIEYAIQFASKFKKVDDVPGGKNISWSKICSHVLVGKEIDEGCSHANFNEVTKRICADCGKEVKDED